jgi:hypothetical protein
MNHLDKISKEVLNLVNYSKDVTKNNVIEMNLGLNSEQLNKLLEVIDNSIEQSYHRGISNFQKNIEYITKR